jgi:hypothetical protein
MKSKRLWLSISLFNFWVVTLLGVLLRTKSVFSLPGIDYNQLLNTHSRFALGAWVTLVLVVLMTFALLPEERSRKRIYPILFGSITVTSWALIFTLPIKNHMILLNVISTLYILVTYVFSWVFIRDVYRAFRSKTLSRTTMLLAISAVLCLVLSSGGIFMLAYLFAMKCANIVLYRDALFSFLHLQYNGFFTLSVLVLLFHHLERYLTPAQNRQVYRFAVLLAFSVIPSMFLSYHWSDPSIYFHVMAYLGSTLLIVTVLMFIPIFRYILNTYVLMNGLTKLIGILSLSAFMLKMMLLGLTIFNFVGNPVFGDRPIIMGFLHMVFLVFVTLFIMIYLVQESILDLHRKFTRFALLFFTIGVIINEILLWSQGIGSLFVLGSNWFPWLLWGAGIWLSIGVLFINLSRTVLMPVFKSEQMSKKAVMGKG